MAAIFDVIRFDGLKSRDWLIYKCPVDDIVYGSQLIVQEGQVAIFVNGGQVADCFGPGTFKMDTENLPLLRKLVNLPFGGKTPFSAEVYFVNTTVRLDINWGTIDPIQLIDPKYYVKLRVRAFGQMGVRVIDPVTMFKEIIGGMQRSEIVKMDKIKEYYRGILVVKVKSAIADTIINNGISALEISTRTEALADSVREQITPEFEQYGFSITNFFIQSINFPDEDFEKINKILEDKAAFELMGDGRYATKRTFDIYEGAANNQNGPAGAMMAGGMAYGAAQSVAMGATNAPISNPMQSTARMCVSCGKPLPSDARFCPACGFDHMEKVCECGTKLAPGTRFCPQCGKPVQ